MGLFPPGTNYQGMRVFPLTDAAGFATRYAFPAAHPQATRIQVIEQTKRPQTAAAFARYARQASPAPARG